MSASHFCRLPTNLSYFGRRSLEEVAASDPLDTTISTQEENVSALFLLRSLCNLQFVFHSIGFVLSNSVLVLLHLTTYPDMCTGLSMRIVSSYPCRFNQHMLYKSHSYHHPPMNLHSSNITLMRVIYTIVLINMS